MQSENQNSDGWVTHYISAARSFCFLSIGVGSVPLGIFLFGLGHAKLKFAGIIFLIVGPFLILKTLRMIAGGNIAFRYSRDGIQVPGTLWTRRASWSDVSKISIVQHTTYALGFIPTTRQQFLYVHPASGWKFYVPTNWAGLAKEEMHKLAVTFDTLRLRQANSSRLSSYSPKQEEPTNDYADAVVARYMARKAEEERAAGSGSAYQSQSRPQSSGVTFGKRRDIP